MRKAAMIFAALSLALVSVGAGASSASAKPDKRPCVTKGEWRKIDADMSPKRVHGILDTKGYSRFVSPDDPDDVYRLYRACRPYNKYSSLEINFYNGRVWAKASYWVKNANYSPRIG